MTIKSFMFKSTRAKVESLNKDNAVEKNFNGILSTGIDPTTLTILESILTGVDCYKIYEKGDYGIIKRVDEEDDNSNLFVSSSSTLIHCLKELTSENKENILQKWCETEEMKLYGWTPDKALEIIDWLIDIAQENSPDEQIMLYIDLNDELNKCNI
jgi:hypothetical protein